MVCLANQVEYRGQLHYLALFSGVDVDEFSALLRTLSPKMKDKAEAQGARLLVARERLQQRVGEVFGEGRASDEPPTATCKAIVLGASRSGKTDRYTLLVRRRPGKRSVLAVFSVVCGARVPDIL